MRKLVVSVFLVIGMAVTGYTQEVSDEVKRFLDNYTKDSTAKWGPLVARKVGLLPDSIQTKDLRVRTVEVYTIKSNISIDAYPDTVAFSELIEPTGEWLVLVMAHNKPLYQLTMYVYPTGPELFRATGSIDPMWELLLKTYPASTGINPVLISTDLQGRSLGGNMFFYFKQKGPRKIYHLGSRWGDDTIKPLFSGSMENLDDSRKLVQHWKRRGIKRNGRDIPDESARRTNVRAIGANENIEPQDVRSGTSGLFIQTDTSRQTFENIKPQGITSPVGGPK